MRKQHVLFIALFICVSVFALPGPLLAADVRGKAVAIPGGLEAGDAVAVPLGDYWRSNARASVDGLTVNKADFPYVLNLIEYRFEAAGGGRFELQAKYRVLEPSPAQLRVNGHEIAALFDKPGDYTADWSSLGDFPLYTGTNFVRFTSRWVETPFPLVTAMRLVYRGGPVPAPEPELTVQYLRPTLAKDWYKSVSRKIHCDFHNAGFIHNIGQDFKAGEYVHTLKQAGINAIVVFAKCRHGYAYYNTRVGTRHPGLNFDLLGRQIQACRNSNIAIWAYVCVGEEELFTSTLEQPLSHPDRRSIKIRPEIGSAYEKYELTPMIRELVCSYDLDGLYIDFPETEDFIRQTTDLVKSLRPGMVVAFNHQWTKSRAEQAKLDINELESWDHKMAFYHWQYFARYARGAVPLTAMALRFWKAWGDFGGLADEAMLRFQVATGQANGCLITIGDHLHPFGRLDPAVYDRIGRVLRDAQTVEPYVIDSESVPYVALHRPRNVKLSAADEDCRALIDSAIHFTVVDPAQDLSPFKAVIVPDAADVGAEEVPRFEHYVAAGGRLLLMGKPDEALARLAGIRLQAGEGPAYIRISPAVLPTPPAMDVFSYLDMIPAEPLEGTQVRAPLIWPLGHGTPYGSRQQSPPEDRYSDLAAITQRTLGRGQVVYIGAPLLKVYASWGCTAMREILADLLKLAIPPADRLLDVDADVPLEGSLNRQGNRLIVHLVHCPQSRLAACSWNKDDYVHRQPIVSGMPTVAGAKIHMPAALVKDRKFRLLTGDAPLKPTTADGRTTVPIPDFRIRAVVVIE